MNNPARLADHIDDRLDAIIEVWRETVSREGDVPESGRLSHEEFVDHVPELLEQLAERLRGRPGDAEAPARQHGRLRWRQGYDVSAVVRELGHLRSTLVAATFDFVRRHGHDLDMLEAALGAIEDVLHEATADSVLHHEDLQRRSAERTLAEVEERTRTADEARAAATAAQLKLRTVLACLPVGVWVVAPDGTIRAANPEAERLRHDSVPAAGRTLAFDLFRPDEGAPERDGREPLVARALRGETVAREEQLWRREGRRLAVMVSAAPIVADGGPILGAVVVAQDITARKAIEDQLRASQKSYRDLYEFAPDMMLSVDAVDARIVECNLTVAQTMGYPREAILGRPVFEFYHPESQAAVRAAFQTFRATGEIRDAELRVVRRDGTAIDISLNATAVRDDSGRILRSRAVWRNITERKRLEAELADRESQFRAIAEQSPVLIWRAGVDGLCDYFNPTWLDFRGRTAEQESGEGWAEGVHPEDLERSLATYRAALHRREPFERIYRLLRHDGQYRWITDHGAPFHDARGRFAGYLGSCVDITDRIELEAALERQKEMALESSRHKTHLLSALSHDARTPLHAVVLAAELLEDQVRDQADPEVDECLRTIRNSVRNVLDLLGDLLDLSKIDAGANPLEPSRFALGAVLAECVSSVENQARIKGLDFHVEPGPLDGLQVETDRPKLKQILGNLLSNAVRYTERGAVRVSGGIDGGQITVAVVDTGIGIDPLDQARIFDEFARLTNPRKPSSEGTGLGLAICRRLALLLGGEILLESRPGLGSVFTLCLPAHIIRHGQAPPEPPDGRGNGNGNGSGAVLVVEDHEASRQYLAKVLARMGYRPIQAGNGLEALEAVEAETPIAVLMDVNMPIMDGIDATTALRADPRFRELPIFALTGDVTAENQRRIGIAGVDGYLEKPVTMERLRDALASLADRDPTPA